MFAINAPMFGVKLNAMTEKQFFASKWKPFEIMTVFIKEIGRDCECYLIGIEFEDRIMKLRPLDTELYEDGIYEVKIDVVNRGESKPMMRVLK